MMKMMISTKLLFSSLALLTLVGCGGGSDGAKTAANIVLPTSYTPNNGRLLGSVGCAQCHGTNGVSVTSWDSIAGDGEFATENFSNHPIMQTIADGYSVTEKSAIDSWLNSMSEYENDNDD